MLVYFTVNCILANLRKPIAGALDLCGVTAGGLISNLDLKVWPSTRPVAIEVIIGLGAASVNVQILQIEFTHRTARYVEAYSSACPTRGHDKSL